MKKKKARFTHVHIHSHINIQYKHSCTEPFTYTHTASHTCTFARLNLKESLSVKVEQFERRYGFSTSEILRQAGCFVAAETKKTLCLLF